jgi:hypothetical protein
MLGLCDFMCGKNSAEQVDEVVYRKYLNFIIVDFLQSNGVISSLIRRQKFHNRFDRFFLNHDQIRAINWALSAFT